MSILTITINAINATQSHTNATLLQTNVKIEIFQFKLRENFIITMMMMIIVSHLFCIVIHPKHRLLPRI